MMIGTTRAEIQELNKINLIEYLLKTDKNNCKIRKNGTITHKQKDNLVIWENHSYDFGSTVNPLKDVIGTLRILYDYDFMQTINKLRDYKDSTNGTKQQTTTEATATQEPPPEPTEATEPDYEEQIPDYNFYD